MDSRSRNIIAVLSGLLVVALAVILALLLRGGGSGDVVSASSTANTQTSIQTDTVKSVPTSTRATETVDNSSPNSSANDSTTAGVTQSSAPSPDAGDGALPTAVGESSITTIVDIGSRLTGAPNSGTSIKYANGGYQVSYQVSASVQDWHVGDRVRLYLESVPSNCPPGDNRGKLYKATNLRTSETFEAYDSEHMCGGA